MAENEDKLQQAKGKLKETAGRITGNDRLKGEGLAEQAKGKVGEKTSEARETARGMWEGVKGERRSEHEESDRSDRDDREP